MNNPPSNAHAAHPERLVVTCPLVACGKTHLPYTKLAQAHRRAALRSSPPAGEIGLVLYESIANAATLREARRIAADLWRKGH